MRLLLDHSHDDEELAKHSNHIDLVGNVRDEVPTKPTQLALRNHISDLAVVLEYEIVSGPEDRHVRLTRSGSRNCVGVRVLVTAVLQLY